MGQVLSPERPAVVVLPSAGSRVREEPSLSWLGREGTGRERSPRPGALFCPAHRLPPSSAAALGSEPSGQGLLSPPPSHLLRPPAVSPGAPS